MDSLSRTDGLYKRIMSKLGAGVLEVELKEEMFTEALKEAIEIFQPYVTESKFITLPSASKIDMSKYGASEVEEVYENPYGVRDIEFNPLAVLINSKKLNFKDFAIRQATLSEVGAQTRKHFQFHEGFLYLDGFVGNVTVEYYPYF